MRLPLFIAALFSAVAVARAAPTKALPRSVKPVPPKAKPLPLRPAPPRPAPPPVDDAAEPDDAADEEATSEQIDREDSDAIDAAVNEGLKEYEELRRAEEQAFPDTPATTPNLRRLGVANPLRWRAEDTLGRLSLLPEGLCAEPLLLGDSGELLAELGGIDLATLKSKFDIPIELNDEVLANVRFINGVGRGFLNRWLGRSHRWIPFERAET